MKELTLPATLENIAAVTDFVNEQLEEIDCPILSKLLEKVPVNSFIFFMELWISIMILENPVTTEYTALALLPTSSLRFSSFSGTLKFSLPSAI